MSAHDRIRADLVAQFKNPELGYVYLRAAYVSLASNLFQDAFNLFLRSQCDPRLVVRMFPDLRHPLISSRDETTVYQGVQAEVLDAKSVDDFSKHLGRFNSDE